MKSGTQSRLTLVDRNGREISVQADDADVAAAYLAMPQDEETSPVWGAGERSRRNQLLVFGAVSAGCATAAIITGSYALWLSRRRMADEVLTSVHDILKTCQDRVSQIEEELNRLPDSTASAATTAA